MQVSGSIMDPICDLRCYEPKLFSRALHCGSAIFEAGTLNLAESETFTYAVYFHSIIYQKMSPQTSWLWVKQVCWTSNIKSCMSSCGFCLLVGGNERELQAPSAYPSSHCYSPQLPATNENKFGAPQCIGPPGRRLPHCMGCTFFWLQRKNIQSSTSISKFTLKLSPNTSCHRKQVRCVPQRIRWLGRTLHNCMEWAWMWGKRKGHLHIHLNKPAHIATLFQRQYVATANKFGSLVRIEKNTAYRI